MIRVTHEDILNFIASHFKIKKHIQGKTRYLLNIVDFMELSKLVAEYNKITRDTKLKFKIKITGAKGLKQKEIISDGAIEISVFDDKTKLKGKKLTKELLLCNIFNDLKDEKIKISDFKNKNEIQGIKDIIVENIDDINISNEVYKNIVSIIESLILTFNDHNIRCIVLDSNKSDYKSFASLATKTFNYASKILKIKNDNKIAFFNNKNKNKIEKKLKEILKLKSPSKIMQLLCELYNDKELVIIDISTKQNISKCIYNAVDSKTNIFKEYKKNNDNLIVEFALVDRYEKKPGIKPRSNTINNLEFYFNRGVLEIKVNKTKLKLSEFNNIILKLKIKDKKENPQRKIMKNNIFDQISKGIDSLKDKDFLENIVDNYTINLNNSFPSVFFK